MGRIQNRKTVTKLRETRSLAHAIVHPRQISDDARRSRQSSPLSVALHPASVSRGTRRYRLNLTSVLRSRLTLLEREFRRARRIQFWFQSVVPVAIRPAQRVGPLLASARFARSFTLVWTRDCFPVFCERQCRSSRNPGCVVEPVRSDPAKHHRTTITAARHMSKRNARNRRNTRYEGSSSWTPRWAARWRPQTPTPWTPTPNRLAGRISTVSDKMSNLIFSLSFIPEKCSPRLTAHAFARVHLYVYYCFIFFDTCFAKRLAFRIW